MKNKTALSDLKIRKAKPKEKEYQLGDTGGLYLLVKPNGSKLWQMRYTFNYKRRLTSFGRYPDVSLVQARAIRDKNIELINQGINPIEQKRQKRKQVIIETKGMANDVIDEWLAKEEQRTKPITHASKVRLFNNDVKPYLKKMHISEVGIDDIVKILEKKQKTAKETARRLFGYLNNIFRFAILKGYTSNNPLAQINKSDFLHSHQAKHYPKITNEKILGQLVNDIYNYHGGETVRNVLRLVLHIPLRAENLCNLKWEYIDFEKKTLTIPRENMKIKNKNLDDFVMPLTNEVINILNDQKEFQTKYTSLKEFVFLGSDNNRPVCKDSPNRALERMGYNDEAKGSKIRLHGFRGSFRSIIDTNNNYSYSLKERVLDHHDKNLVVRAYNHKANYTEQMKELMTFWSNFICSLKRD